MASGGASLAYLIIACDTMVRILVDLDIELDYERTRIIIILVAVILVILPLSLLRNLSGLRFVAILSCLTILYIAIVVAVEFPFFYYEHALEGLEWFRFDDDFLTAFAL